MLDADTDTISEDTSEIYAGSDTTALTDFTSDETTEIQPADSTMNMLESTHNDVTEITTEGTDDEVTSDVSVQFTSEAVTSDLTSEIPYDLSTVEPRDSSSLAIDITTVDTTMEVTTGDMTDITDQTSVCKELFCYLVTSWY